MLLRRVRSDPREPSRAARAAAAGTAAAGGDRNR